LEADLLDYPDDTRTLYYLGYAHFDIFSQNKNNATPEHWDHLKKAVDYFTYRIGLKTGSGDEKGNAEERWFSMLKLGEIYERFYRDWSMADKYYTECVRADPDRADAYFYLGQHYRLGKNTKESLPFLRKAAVMSIPQRSLFQWHYLYQCIAKLEYVRALMDLGEKLTVKLADDGINVIAMHMCSEQTDAESVSELRSAERYFRTFVARGKARQSSKPAPSPSPTTTPTPVTPEAAKLQTSESKPTVGPSVSQEKKENSVTVPEPVPDFSSVPEGEHPYTYPIKKFLAWVVRNQDDLSKWLDKPALDYSSQQWQDWSADPSAGPRPVTLYSALLHNLQGMRDYVKAGKDYSCEGYRKAVYPYLRFVAANADLRYSRLGSSAGVKALGVWQKLEEALKLVCPKPKTNKSN